ncbi:hypothetical protein PCANC_22284 [Puccinia coronata f. sp. avenae]|uniref:Uncharacterized protein n=1 Tax=Puccinia coronata f. sp. avenae TaxID=200324 RepID=A0A2N5UTX1_9BASI|nr:hypothetical protein PCANC_22284 [Puccinia coronata f. sp. avenae]
MESATTPVPPKGSPNGWDKRNGHLGAAWASLLPDEKAVFSPPIFQCLSRIPYTIANKEDDENEEIQLSDAEKELYKPLYQNLVNHKKVQSILSKGPESTTTQSSIFKQAEQSLTKLNLGACKPPHALPCMPHAVRTPTNGVRTAGLACGPAGQACWPCTPVRRACRPCMPSGQACTAGTPVRSGSRKPLESRGLREPLGTLIRVLLGTLIRVLLGYQTGTLIRVPNGTLIKVPSGTLIRVPNGTLIRVPLGTFIRVPFGTLIRVPVWYPYKGTGLVPL